MFQVGTSCYPTAEAANAAIASAQVGALLTHGGSVVGVDVVSVTATSITYSFTPLGGSAAQQTFTSTPPPCELLQVADGIGMGWLVGGAYLAVYAVMFMTRGLRGHGDT